MEIPSLVVVMVLASVVDVIVMLIIMDSSVSVVIEIVTGKNNM